MNTDNIRYCLEVFDNITYDEESYNDAKVELFQLEELVNTLNQIKEEANNTIYFGDNSDYLSTLYTICRLCGMNSDEVGESYIGDDDSYE